MLVTTSPRTNPSLQTSPETLPYYFIVSDHVYKDNLASQTTIFLRVLNTSTRAFLLRPRLRDFGVVVRGWFHCVVNGNTGQETKDQILHPCSGLVSDRVARIGGGRLIRGKQDP